jgi:hypothetical protein
MKKTMQKAFFASLGALALTFAAGETFARPAGAQGPGAAAARTMPPAGAHAFRHRRNFVGPIVGGYYGADGAPLLDAPQLQAAPNDVRYTYTYDVPWDWAHRYPPNVTPSERPYVPGCGNETVTVPGRGGREQTINVTRCY